LSKVNAIRKKALEYVRKQDWVNATKEYKRLAELDQSNPNVFNELGDIHLKTGNKADAYTSFSHAIDSYTRVSLHNNAVAVCKKVLRLIPMRYEVLIKLGLIRKKQGLVKEAESYYFSYLDKVLVDQQVSPIDVRKSCDGINDEMADSTPVMERVVECLTRFSLKEDSVPILHHLFAQYSKAGDEAAKEHTRKRLEEAGETPVEVAPKINKQKDGAVITEDNIWTAAHTDGERIEVDKSAQETTPLSAGDRPGPVPDDNKSVYAYGDVKINAADQEQSPRDGTAADPVEQETAGATTQTVVPPDFSEERESPAGDTYTDANVFGVTNDPVAGSEAGNETSGESPSHSGSHEHMQISAIMGDDGLNGESSEEDYRSHYDLGMAYLEMELLAEAIREYQFASKSPKYQARALEMIGLCFLKQNQAGLAIKQLNKGLQAVGDNATESLGIKYNLGLAYEMAGDLEKAKSEFEDVYVEDVTFRDVAQKIEKFS
jgi:tetratricopeptide (TPR) repeat protein